MSSQPAIISADRIAEMANAKKADAIAKKQAQIADFAPQSEEYAKNIVTRMISKHLSFSTKLVEISANHAVAADLSGSHIANNVIISEFVPFMHLSEVAFSQKTGTNIFSSLHDELKKNGWFLKCNEANSNGRLGYFITLSKYRTKSSTTNDDDSAANHDSIDLADAKAAGWVFVMTAISGGRSTIHWRGNFPLQVFVGLHRKDLNGENLHTDANPHHVVYMYFKRRNWGTISSDKEKNMINFVPYQYGPFFASRFGKIGINNYWSKHMSPEEHADIVSLNQILHAGLFPPPSSIPRPKSQQNDDDDDCVDVENDNNDTYATGQQMPPNTSKAHFRYGDRGGRGGRGRGGGRGSRGRGSSD